VQKAYGSYEDLAKDPDIDAVYVGTVHTTHVNVASLMINSGKAVLCEKPMGVNLKEVCELTSLAREKNVFLMEAVWSRFFPAWIELENQIKSGAIGDIKMVMANFGFRLGEDPPERLVQKELAGGAILDIGIYVINMASYVFPGLKIEKIIAGGSLLETGVDEQAGITIVYSDGKLANLCISIGAELPREAFIVGTKGTIKVPFPFWCPTSLETPTRGLLEFPLPKSDVEFNFVNSVGLSYEAEEVRKCLQSGKKESSRMPLAESERVMEIMDEVRRQLGVVFPQDL
jgi:dihydrodiol dehydrogenase / D-xylose 1-dehydrogenase (NADP)